MQNQLGSFSSLLEWKESLRDWHYDPSVNSTDYFYVGQFVGNWQEELEKIIFHEDDLEIMSRVPSVLADSDTSNLFVKTREDFVRWGYHEGNTTLYAKKNIPSYFNQIVERTGLQNPVVKIYKQEPGNTLPWHFDTFSEYAHRYNIEQTEIRKIKRYLMFLKDWHWGHILQIGNNVLHQWRAGDTVMWPYGMYHLACNGGITSKWTLQITGIEGENSLHNAGKRVFTLDG